jgi:hypothetical protein
LIHSIPQVNIYNRGGHLLGNVVGVNVRVTTSATADQSAAVKEVITLDARRALSRFGKDFLNQRFKARIAPERIKDWVHAHSQRKPVGLLRHFR